MLAQLDNIYAFPFQIQSVNDGFVIHGVRRL